MGAEVGSRDGGVACTWNWSDWKWSSKPECDAAGERSAWIPFHMKANGEANTYSDGAAHAK